MSKSLSSKINIFPISFDRTKGVEFSYYVRNNNSIPDDASLTPADSDFLNTVTVYIGDNLPESVRAYYSEMNSVAANPANTYYNGRTLSEHNLATLIEKVTQSDKYVISATFNADHTACETIEFMIKGHYFYLELVDNNTITNNNNLWVNIQILNNINNSDAFQTLYAYDNSNYLEQVTFSSERATDTNKISLQLLEKIGNTVSVPFASSVRFNSAAIQSINGGIV